MFTIYRRLNKITGESYIGQTELTIDSRAGSNGCRYLSLKKNGEYSQPKLANAILKYGWKNFESTILETCETRDEANFLETKYILEFDSIEHGYNCNTGGTAWGSNSGRKVDMISTVDGTVLNTFRSAKYAAAMSGAKNCKRNTNIIRCCKGLQDSAGEYNGIKVTWRYHNETPEEKEFRENNILKRQNNLKVLREKMQAYNTRKSKSVLKIDTMTNNIVCEYASASEAGRDVGLFNSSKIVECCKGYRKSAAGYIWKYKE